MIMRILMSAAPSVGHVIPLLDIGRALQDAGHEVRVATSQSRQGLIAHAGLEALPAGISSDEMVAERLRRWPETAHQPATAWAVRMWVEIMAPATLAGLLPIIDVWRPDLMLHDEGEYGAPIAAAIANIPLVTHGFGSPLRPASELTELEELARPVWAAAGQDMPANAGLYSHGLINPCPPILARTAPGATTVWPLRPRPLQGAGTSIEADAYVGFGTVPTFADAPDELEAAVRACAEQGMRVVVTARTPELRARLEAIDRGHVIAEEFVSLPTTLRNCKVVITHAGAGTVLASLDAGVPLVLVPRGSPSQTRMAAACHEAGVGRSCDTAGIAEALKVVLADEAYTGAARAVADEIASMPPATAVVPRLEKIARG
jgi:UDP:flavonoid glycosyltransferase YjiC (YdhE family)